MKREDPSLSDALAFTIDDASFLMRISRASIYRAVKAGKLTTRKAGRKTMILRRDLERYLNELPAGDDPLPPVSLKPDNVLAGKLQEARKVLTDLKATRDRLNEQINALESALPPADGP